MTEMNMIPDPKDEAASAVNPVAHFLSAFSRILRGLCRRDGLDLDHVHRSLLRTRIRKADLTVGARGDIHLGRLRVAAQRQPHQ